MVKKFRVTGTLFGASITKDFDESGEAEKWAEKIQDQNANEGPFDVVAKPKIEQLDVPEEE